MMDRCLQLQIEPRDLLFFRDAKPMNGSWTGEGANWPAGATMHGAILAAMQRELGLKPGAPQLSGLITIGPFPQKGKELYFPTPLDIFPGGQCLLPAEQPEGCSSNLPKPLTKILRNPGEPTKEEVPRWISSSNLLKYLSGERLEKITETSLFDTEVRPGIGINPATRTTVKKANSTDAEHRYMAKYLRLADDAALSAVVMLNNGMDLLEKVFGNAGCRFLFGGQQCIVSASVSRETSPFFRGEWLPKDKMTRYIKYVLLTPACFDGGWLPRFVNPENGKVMLKTGSVERREGESRDDWRHRKDALPSIDAKLAAARIGTAQLFTGWCMGGRRTGKDTYKAAGPRATRLLVPAGSVYYFETASVEASEQLVKALSGSFYSAMGGEYGYGFGICTNYNNYNK